MARKPETRRQRRIRAALEDEFPDSWWKKIWGGPYQDAGIPDLIGCVEGLFFGFEVKEPGEPLEPLQVEEVGDINQAGGCASRVEAAYEAIDLVRKTIATAKGRR